jgi:hypothetical protein
MVSPFDELGSVVVPPGNVTANVSPGATESGAVIETVMSCICVSVAPPTTA